MSQQAVARKIETHTLTSIQHSGCGDPVCFVDNHPALATAFAPLLGLSGVVVTVLVTSAINRKSLKAALSKERRERIIERKKRQDDKDQKRLDEIALEKSKREALSLVLRGAAKRCSRLNSLMGKDYAESMIKRGGVRDGFDFSQRFLIRAESDNTFYNSNAVFALDNAAAQLISIIETLDLASERFHLLSDDKKKEKLVDLAEFFQGSADVLEALARVNEGEDPSALSVATLIHNWD